MPCGTLRIAKPLGKLYGINPATINEWIRNCNRKDLMNTRVKVETKEINLGKTDNRQFYNWREYEETKWKLNEKVPLLIFASSWLDKEYNFHRFCGVVNLKENDERTQELLITRQTIL